ncbi:MAG: SPOR domain-containing protein [Bacteroidales bacterium]|nr:SPOR domain-containing protein [Bacteroidales bacterium]
MKKLLLTLFLVISCGLLHAQELPDSLRAATVDSTLVGKDILTVIGTGVKVNQSDAVRAAFNRYVAANASRTMTGYRIRVFYESSQSARARSESIARSISANYPGVGVYRTFESPNFKVSVGDFRTKDEALKMFNELKSAYPTALLLKETINYPL